MKLPRLLAIWFILFGTSLFYAPSANAVFTGLVQVTCNDGTFSTGWDNSNQYFATHGNIAAHFCELVRNTTYVSDNLTDNSLRWYNGVVLVPIITPINETVTVIVDTPTVVVDTPTVIVDTPTIIVDTSTTIVDTITVVDTSTATQETVTVIVEPTPIVPTPQPDPPIVIPNPTPVAIPDPPPVIEPQPPIIEPEPIVLPQPEPEPLPPVEPPPAPQEPEPEPEVAPIEVAPEPVPIPQQEEVVVPLIPEVAPEPPLVKGLEPNSPNQLPDDIPKMPEDNLLTPHIQEDKAGVENGGIEFFGTKSQPQVIGEDGNLTPPPPPPGSGLPIPADAITVEATFIGQPGGTTFNSPDVAVPIPLVPLEGAIAAIPGAQALNKAFNTLQNIGNDMSPITRKKAKKILVITATIGQIAALRRRF